MSWIVICNTRGYLHFSLFGAWILQKVSTFITMPLIFSQNITFRNNQNRVRPTNKSLNRNETLSHMFIYLYESSKCLVHLGGYVYVNMFKSGSTKLNKD